MRFGTCGLVSILVCRAFAFAEEAAAPHVRVQYSGLLANQAQAIADTVSTAWTVYTDEFGFDMPATIFVEATCAPGAGTRLFTDGEDRLYLSLSDSTQLAKPESSGVFNLYGMCHELGHVAMYRLIKQRDWMTPACAEGWAHYAGSYVVDRVFALRGESLWFDPYDYRKDGMARLNAQRASANAGEVTRGAGQWMELEKTIGTKGFPALFKAWQGARIEREEPAAGLLAGASQAFSDQRSKIVPWWKSAAPLFVEKRAASATRAETLEPAKLSGRTWVLKGDDGTADGKKSIAGGGHARMFEAPGGTWYLRAVSLFGSRYGTPQAPAEDFELALCDESMAVIATWPQPYSTFERGTDTWVRMEVPPTRVPSRFYLCFAFRPTGTKGVYVSFDASSKGHSQTAVPGKPGAKFEGGNWMIRAELDQPKSADALAPSAP